VKTDSTDRLESEPPVPNDPLMEIRPGEPLAEALQRLALEQVAVVRNGFAPPNDDETLDQRVHLARKAAKRTRGLLRLVRDEIGTETYRNENAVLRDQARRLSELRIAHVWIGTADAVFAAYPSAIPQAEAARIRSELVARHRSVAAALRSEADGRAAAKMTLDCLRARLQAWPLPSRLSEQGYVALEPAISRVYRRGRHAMWKAEKEQTSTTFHEWRKQVNYLRYQMEALSGATGPAIARLAASLHELADVLGDQHDLADLAELIEGDLTLMPDSVHRVRCFEVIAQRHNHLRLEALGVGRALYSDSARRFIALLGESWPSPQPAG